MRQLIAVLATGMLVTVTCATQAQTGAVGHFHKVIVSPYIQATFVQADEESVTINSAIVDTGKLHVEVHDGTLRLYLDGAKDLPHDQSNYRVDDGWESRPLYPSHAVLVTIRYRRLDALSLRGTETWLCESPLSAKKFFLHVYGEGTVIFTEVHLTKMHSTLFGECSLDIRSGQINKQIYTCFGNGKINSTAISGQVARVTTFGEAELKVNVADRIKVTTFGEARVCYMGNPSIVKGLHFGGVDLQRLN